jgi:1-acyl-sn-glycerol-3-phosphate acyltransferase
MAQRLINTLASIWTWGVLALVLTAFFPVIVLWRVIGWPVDRWNYAGGLLFRGVARVVHLLTPRWRFELRGTFPRNPRLPYVMVANHESFVDILLLSQLPWEMKWLSKVSLWKIPVFGWSMWAVRDVPVHRGKASSARDAMAACRQRLDGKVSVMIFPREPARRRRSCCRSRMGRSGWRSRRACRSSRWRTTARARHWPSTTGASARRTRWWKYWSRNRRRG